MLELTLALASIALLDSISPARMGALVTILGGRLPYLRAGLFVSGLFLSYLILGVLMALGADWVLDQLFNVEPPPADFVMSAAIGVVIIVFGVRTLLTAKLEREVEPKSDSLVATFFLAFHALNKLVGELFFHNAEPLIFTQPIFWVTPGYQLPTLAHVRRC